MLKLAKEQQIKGGNGNQCTDIILNLNSSLSNCKLQTPSYACMGLY